MCARVSHVCAFPRVHLHPPLHPPPDPVVVKPSENSPFTAVMFARLTLGLSGGEALPPGVLNVVVGAGEAGAALSAHPGVAKVGGCARLPAAVLSHAALFPPTRVLPLSLHAHTDTIIAVTSCPRPPPALLAVGGWV